MPPPRRESLVRSQSSEMSAVGKELKPTRSEAKALAAGERDQLEMERMLAVSGSALMCLYLAGFGLFVLLFILVGAPEGILTLAAIGLPSVLVHLRWRRRRSLALAERQALEQASLSTTSDEETGSPSDDG